MENSTYSRITSAVTIVLQLALLGIVAYYGRSFSYLLFDYFRPEVPKHFLFAHFADLSVYVWRFAFYIHILATLPALLMGPFLFSSHFRNRFLQWHRNLGKFYVLAILCGAAPSGLILSFYALHGWRAGLSFFILSIVWAATTYKALMAIQKKNLPSHQRWMMRSYALTLAAISQRIWSQKLGFWIDESAFTYIAGAWLGWTVNLAFAEVLIRSLRQTK